MSHEEFEKRLEKCNCNHEFILLFAEALDFLLRMNDRKILMKLLKFYKKHK